MGVVQWDWAAYTEGRLARDSAQVTGEADHCRLSSVSSSGHSLASLTTQSAKTLTSFVLCSDPFSLVTQGTRAAQGHWAPGGGECRPREALNLSHVQEPSENSLSLGTASPLLTKMVSTALYQKFRNYRGGWSRRRGLFQDT